MIAEHYARKWQGAGLIDAGAVERILAWEGSRRQPVWLWSVAGIGALAIALGVMAIIGANWDSIPDGLKLGAHLAATVVCAVALFVAWRHVHVWRRELAAFLMLALVLAGIALIGQVYQLQSDLWHAMVLWLALCTPFLALTTFTRFNATLWTIAAATTWFTAADPIFRVFAWLHLLPETISRSGDGYFAGLLMYLPGCGLIMAAALRHRWAPARHQADMILKLSLAGLAAACSIASSFAWSSQYDMSLWRSVGIAAVATLAAGAAYWPGRSAMERRLVLAFLAATLIVWALAFMNAGLDTSGHKISHALLFIVYWGVIGGLAAHAGWRGWFGFAFTMVGLRLLVLYFEAIGGLTATGLGLLGGGVLCIVLAAIGWRLTRRVARTP